MSRGNPRWDTFFDRIERQKAKHPEIGAEYEAVSESIRLLEKEANEKFNIFSMDSTKHDYAGFHTFTQDRIAPLEKRLTELWNLLMDKKVHNNTLAPTEAN